MKLAVAFGARGAGDSAATYEMERKVINLTKMRGAGCLANEWAVALDNYMCHICNGNEFGMYSNEWSRTHRDCLESFRELSCAFYNVINAIEHGEHIVENGTNKYIFDMRIASLKSECDGHKESARRYVRSIEQEFSRSYRISSSTLVEYADKMSDIREHIFEDGYNYSDIISKINEIKTSEIIDIEYILKPLEGAYNGYKGAMNEILEYTECKRDSYERSQSNYYRECARIDNGRTQLKYSTVSSKFARAFEAYVNDKLAKSGIVSDYLVHSTDSAEYEKVGMGKPYPEGNERTIINRKFDEFFDTYRKRLAGGVGFPANWGAKYTNMDGTDLYSVIKENVKRVRNAVNSGDVSSADSVKKIQSVISGKEIGTDERLVETAEDIRKLLYEAADNAQKVKCSFDTLAKVTEKIISASVYEGEIPVELRRGNSKAWVMTKSGLRVLESAAEEKKEEAIIEYIVTVKVFEKYGKTVAANMIREGVVLSVCRLNSLDVRTYCQSEAYDNLAKDTVQLKPYLRIVSGLAAEIAQKFGII